LLDPYNILKEGLEKNPFILIIGKYDEILGPKALYYSIPISNEDFIKKLLRDALNTDSKHVILDFNRFYAQVNKIEIVDPSARGESQSYALIFLRDEAQPLIPITHLKRIEMFFHRIGQENILSENKESFHKFSSAINEIYIKKDYLLPIEALNLKVRSAINTIQGFGELSIEGIKNMNISEEMHIYYIELMLKSCKEILDALDDI